MDTGRSPSPEIKRQGREADHTHPSSAEVNKVDLYIHSPMFGNGMMMNLLVTERTFSDVHTQHVPGEKGQYSGRP
jgi:hypothetical protein